MKIFAVFSFSLLIFIVSPLESQERYVDYNEKDIEYLKEALKYSDANMWVEAFNEIEKTKNKNLKNLITWLKLRQEKGNFEEYLIFIKQNKDWPLLREISKKGEKTLTDKVPEHKVLNYFSLNKNCIELERLSQELFRKFCLPGTAQGSFQLIKTKKIRENSKRYNQILNNLIVRQNLSKKEFDLLLKKYNSEFQDLKYQRLKYFISRNDIQELKRLSSYVDKENQSLLKRVFLLKKGNKSSTIKFRKDFSNNEHLVYERVSYLRRSGQYDKAQEIIRKFSVKNYNKLQDPRWLNVKQIYALRALRGGYGKRAYQIAKTNYNYSDKPYIISDYLYLEWLAGFIALEFNQNPKLAIKHFHNFLSVLIEWENKCKIIRKLNINENIISFDVAKARIGYWLGRAYEIQKDNKNSKKYYLSSAKFDYTFYGQLSMERAKIKPNKRILEISSHNNKLKPLQNELIDVSLNLFFAERGVLADYFAGEGSFLLNEKERKDLSKKFLQLGFTKGALTIAKKSNELRNPIYEALFPLHDILPLKQKIDPALVLSVIRQESEFFRAAKSRTGALGLMQVMPATAKEVSRKLKIKYVKRDLLIDENYNVQIGTYYLKYLLNRFEGSKILSLAAYNAGPGKLKKWVDKMGDPRKKGIDPLIWIELIPYGETRNYLKRVLEAYWPYKMKINQELSPPNLGKKYFGHQF